VPLDHFQRCPQNENVTLFDAFADMTFEVVPRLECAATSALEAAQSAKGAPASEGVGPCY
jgi:hypothetical protein